MGRVRQTSMNEWLKNFASLGKRQALVFNAICRLGRCTRKQISDYTNLPINSITPRVLELIERRMVKEDGEVLQKNGRSAMVVVVV